MGKEQRGQITPEALKALKRIHFDIVKTQTNHSQPAISTSSEQQIKEKTDVHIPVYPADNPNATMAEIPIPDFMKKENK